jgi:hypothetical protein
LSKDRFRSTSPPHTPQDVGRATRRVVSVDRSGRVAGSDLTPAGSGCGGRVYRGRCPRLLHCSPAGWGIGLVPSCEKEVSGRMGDQRRPLIPRWRGYFSPSKRRGEGGVIEDGGPSKTPHPPLTRVLLPVEATGRRMSPRGWGTIEDPSSPAGAGTSPRRSDGEKEESSRMVDHRRPLIPCWRGCFSPPARRGEGGVDRGRCFVATDRVASGAERRARRR